MPRAARSALPVAAKLNHHDPGRQWEVHMANEDHVVQIKRGVKVWNKWRKKNSDVVPDLLGADLTGAHLTGAYLRSADLTEATLTEANLCDADLRAAALIDSRLDGADLTGA